MLHWLFRSPPKQVWIIAQSHDSLTTFDEGVMAAIFLRITLCVHVIFVSPQVCV